MASSDQWAQLNAEIVACTACPRLVQWRQKVAQEERAAGWQIWIEAASPGVEAVMDTMLYTIPCERFRRIMRDHHGVALAVMEYLGAEVRRLSDMVEDLALHTVRTRLARFLLTQAEGTQPSKQRTLGRWTQEEIAAHIGTVREMVGRTLRAFAAAGLIHRQRGRIVVVDREGLEREAAGG